MTMKFRTIKDNIVKILVDNSKNCFQVVGHQRQTLSAEDTKGNDRLVQVFYSFGDFPESSSSAIGPVQHDVNYRIELIVSADAKTNLKVLDNPNSSAAEIQAALSSSLEASAVADDELDELYELVYQILMDANNYELGMDIGDISNRWVNQFQKNDPLDRGECIVLTGSMFLKARTPEEIVGISAVPNGDIQDVTIDIADDDTEKTGIETN